MITELLESTGLPLLPHLPTIVSKLKNHGAVVVRADPGSGKSTLIPLALLAAADKVGDVGRILMLEPRRIAAVSIAGRMAELLDEEVGATVGYSVRLERAVSARTRIEVLTEGLLVRRIQGDPDLAGIGTVIFDEFHERSVQADLALALLLDLRRIRSELRILVLSATLDAVRVADFIAGVEGGRGCAVVDCPGRAYPVEIRYSPVDGHARIGEACAHAVADHLGRADKPGANGSTLVFLPGRREIGDAVAVLSSRLDRDLYEIHCLHGGLALAEQRRVLAPQPQGLRRVILSTNVAETGLTVPAVTTVVDSGWVRLERFHLPTGMDRLSLEPASRHSADQRAGRAGRLGPGICLRLWNPQDHRPPDTECELLRVDLSSLVLECALWGAYTPEALPWLDEPPRSAWNGAVVLLRELGALDAAGRPTVKGRRMAALGLAPRPAALVLSTAGTANAPLACAAAATLSDRDGSLIRDDADFRRRLAILRGASPGDGGGAAEAWRRRTLELARDLMVRLGLRAEALRWTAEGEAGAGALLAAGFPDRLARLQGRGRFRFSSGREGRIEGPLASEEWICAAEADAGERLGSIRLAAPVSAEDALSALAPLTVEERKIEWKGLIPRTMVRTSAGRLILSEVRSKSSRGEAAADLARLLASEGLGLLPWDEAGGAPRRYFERLRFAAGRSGVPGLAAEEWTDAVLTSGAEKWLGPFLWKGAETGTGSVIDGEGLLEALRWRLGWAVAADLDKLVPAELDTPALTRRRLDYASGEPILRLRIQEVFGLCEGPRILGLPVAFQLLSPADRPLQTTRDLGGFWAGSYAEVRKEMRGRYPKHYWPEDPRLAEPRRGSGKPKTP